MLRQGAVTEIRLIRGRRGNAIDLRTAEAFASAVSDVVGDPGATVVLLSASGENFCVGGDVAEFHAAGDVSGLLRRTTSVMHPAIMSLVTSPTPVVAAVQGAVAGAGLGLVLAADLVVAADDAVFTAGYLSLAMSPDCGVSQLLPARVGRVRAVDLLLTGRRVTAPEALDWGLVTRLCPAVPDAPAQAGASDIEGVGGVWQLSRQLAERLAVEPREAVAATLRLIGIGDLAQGLAAEREFIAELVSTPAARARMTKFVPAATERAPSSSPPSKDR